MILSLHYQPCFLAQKPHSRRPFAFAASSDSNHAASSAEIFCAAVQSVVWYTGSLLLSDAVVIKTRPPEKL